MLTASIPGLTVGPVEVVDVALLSEDPNNVNMHSDRDLAATEASLTAFGQVEPLIIRRKDNTPIGGNGRLRILKSKGIAKVEVRYVDGPEDALTALGIALNKTARNSEFDTLALSAQLKELDGSSWASAEGVDLVALTGFADYELEPLLAAEAAGSMSFAPTPSTIEDDGGVAPTPAASSVRGLTLQFPAELRGAMEELAAELGTSPVGLLTELFEVEYAKHKGPHGDGLSGV